MKLLDAFFWLTLMTDKTVVLYCSQCALDWVLGTLLLLLYSHLNFTLMPVSGQRLQCNDVCSPVSQNFLFATED